jgi:hypothetical protein
VDKLRDAYRTGRLILFVGAGVSANLGLPNWSELIGKIADDLGYDPAIFATYGNHLALAEYYKRMKGSIGPLRSWMDREWHNPNIEIKTSTIHQHIVAGNFSRIYTTNYDRWLEFAHDYYGVPYVKISNASDLVIAEDTQRQIIKLHGDFDDDSSIVLDETSYFNRLDFESPLDIKLRADVIGKSVLFVGYSISDINIRLLFFKLTKTWSQQPMATHRPVSYLFSNRPNPVAEEILRHWGIKMVVSETDDPGLALTEFLNNIIS